MNKNQLYKELENTSALRENRLRVSNLILEDVSCIKHLIDIVFDVNDEISVKAAWVLEFVAKKDLTPIFPFLNIFTKNIQKVHFGGAVRSLAKISQLLIEKNNRQAFLTETQKELFIETAFDWMISTHKVAIKAYSMRNLFLLGKETDWVHDELKIIIQDNISKESAAYKSRGRITLDQIEKYLLVK